jgi:hypothetical protein
MHKAGAGKLNITERYPENSVDLLVRDILRMTVAEHIAEADGENLDEVVAAADMPWIVAVVLQETFQS